MSSNRDHRNNFNLVRLIAAVQVMVVHACNHFEYSNRLIDVIKVIPGVPVFFFISGYLIYSAYDRKQPADIRAFFANRVLRIYPALLVCVALSVLSVYLTGYFHGRGLGWGHFTGWLVGQVTFFQFYNPPFMREYGVGVLNGALWTISVELQFYLLTPLLHHLLWRRPAVLWLMFSASLMVNMAANYALRDKHIWDLMAMKLLMVSFAPWVYMFIVGLLAASTEAWRVWAQKIRFEFVLAGFVLSMVLIGPYEVNASNSINPVAYLLLAVLIWKLATASLPFPEWLNEFIRKTDFSYGIYLYHMPVINFILMSAGVAVGARIPLTLAACIAWAALSWYLVERVALSFKR